MADNLTELQRHASAVLDRRARRRHPGALGTIKQHDTASRATWARGC